MGHSDSVVIVGAARTPIGKLGGVLSQVPSPTLGAAAIRAAMERAEVEPERIDYTIMGNVLSAGLGQAPARQAAIGAGIPDTNSALTVNKVCASGLMSVILGAQMIRGGDLNMVAAGGMESMSLAPHIVPSSRFGKRLGNWEMVDTVIHDGLWCSLSTCPMGTLAERTGSKYEVTRDEQDRLALMSHRRATAAIDGGGFSDEVTPVTVRSRRDERVVEVDEGPRRDTSMAALARLAPSFPPGETVTAGNAAQISDGAAAVILTGESQARASGLTPLARIDDYTFVANEPADLFEAPAMAVDRLLEKGGLTLNDVDLMEVNEAFAAQVLANGKALDWDWDRVNVKGGATALGHPIGASGARILVTLLYSLRERGLASGIAALCHGGGGAVAVRVSLL